MNSKPTPRKVSRLGLLVALPGLMIGTMACGFGSIIDIRDQSARVDLNVTEQMINRALHDPDTHIEYEDQDLLTDIDRVDFQDGKIVVYGRAETEAGKQVDGSYELTVETADGQLQVEITAVDIPGVELDDPAVQRANDEAAEALMDVARDADNEVRFETVEINDDQMRMVVEVNWEE